MSVDSRQRFTRSHPCPICGGFDSAKRGNGARCYGFLSDDGAWAHCTREELAGTLTQHPDSETYAHRLEGDCKCGERHGDYSPPIGATAEPEFDLWSFTRTYDYRDERGRLAFQVCRYDSPKTFRQRRPTVPHPDPQARKHWEWKLGDTRTVLYRLPELIAAPVHEPVYITEGEKDADRLISLGLVATTCPMGAGKWRDHYKEWLRDRTVAILPDNDEPGKRHAQAVARALKDVAASVQIIVLTHVPEHGDVSDWLDGGGTLARLRDKALGSPTRNRQDIITLQDLLRLEIPPAQWAVHGILPEGAHLFVGKSKIGKSWAALGLILAVGYGGRAFGQIEVEPGEVLYLALEDNERRLQTRCQEILAEVPPPNNVYLTLEWPRLHEGGLEKLDTWLTEHPKTRLVVVDTLKKVRAPAGRDGNVYDRDYESVEGMHALAAKHHVAIQIIHHMRKGSAEDPLDTINGSGGLAAGADGVWIFERQRGQNEATLYVTHREAEDQELALTWDTVTRSWTIAGNAEDYRISKERQEIIDLMTEQGESMSIREVAEALEKNRFTTKNLVRKMASEGALTRVGTSHYRVVPGAFGGKSEKTVVPVVPPSIFGANPPNDGTTEGEKDRSPSVVPVVSKTTPDYDRTTAKNGQRSPMIPQQDARNGQPDYGDYANSPFLTQRVCVERDRESIVPGYVEDDEWEEL